MYRIIGWRKLFYFLGKARFAWLEGMQGSGKTLLASALGHKLLSDWRVNGVCSNYPLSYAVAPYPRHMCICLDEIGALFDNRFSGRDKATSLLMNRLTYNLRKRGSYLICSSFADPDSRLRNGVRIVRYKSNIAGGRVWAYKWEFGPSEPEKRDEYNFVRGIFYLVNPAYFFGVYDTNFDPPAETTVRFLGHVLAEKDAHIADKLKTE